MSTYLIQSSLLLSTPSRAIMYDEAIHLCEQGDNVFYLYCGGVMSQCFINARGNKAVCKICKSFCKKEQGRFKGKFEFISANEIVSAEQKARIKGLTFEYNDIKDIKELEFEGINIGLGALSAYITVSRNMNPLMDETFRVFFDESLRNSVLYFTALQESVKRFNPDNLIIFNGRFADSRPSWEFATKNNIPFTTLEAIYGIKRNYKARYISSTPFSLRKTLDIANELWNNENVSLEHKIAAGSAFFERRRNAQYTGDKIYTANQQEGLLPDNWDKEKHNIVIFNSSEDEFAAVGGELEEKALFKSQIEGLDFLKDYFRDNNNVDITLRIHPNLSNVRYSYSTDLFKMGEAGFRVIDGKSPISTYSLIDAADVVVVFGSTVGAEAPYWGKPVVLLGGATYYYFDCCYTPQTKEEMLELITTNNLAPKDKLGAIKFGYILMTEDWEIGSNVDFDWSYWNLFGKYSVQLNNWQKTLNSRKIYSFFNAVSAKLLRLIYKFTKNGGDKFTLPTKER